MTARANNQADSIIFQLGYTALQRATLEGHVEMVRLLVDANAMLEKQDFVVRNCLPTS